VTTNYRHSRLRQHLARQQKHPASNQTLDGEFVLGIAEL
jgi:hypothetical protein